MIDKILSASEILNRLDPDELPKLLSHESIRAMLTDLIKDLPEKMMINTAIGRSSLCGVSGKFPFKRGNYCSNVDGMYVSNMWYENIKHLVDTNVIDSEMLALVFTEHGMKYAYIIDPRIPKEALNKPYFCGIKTSVKVLRHHYDVPEDKCVCEHVPETISWTSFGYDEKNNKCTSKTGICNECNSKYEFIRTFKE